MFFYCSISCLLQSFKHLLYYLIFIFPTLVFILYSEGTLSLKKTALSTHDSQRPVSVNCCDISFIQPRISTQAVWGRSKGDTCFFQDRGAAGRQWEVGFFEPLPYPADRRGVASLLGLSDGKQQQAIEIVCSGLGLQLSRVWESGKNRKLHGAVRFFFLWEIMYMYFGNVFIVDKNPPPAFVSLLFLFPHPQPPPLAPGSLIWSQSPHPTRMHPTPSPAPWSQCTHTFAPS